MASKHASISIREHQNNRASGFQTIKTLIVSSAHAFHDTYSGFFAPLLPYLIERLSLLKAEAGVFLLLYQGASILQPVIGHIGDQKNLRKYALLMPAITGIALSFLGVAPNFQTGLLLSLIAGISSASLHSILPALVSSLSGNRVGKGMGIWMVMGEFGIMIGPLLVTFVITFFGIQATPWLMIPGIINSVLLSFLLRGMPHHNIKNLRKAEIPYKKLATVILPLAGMIIMRSPLRTTAEIFLPVYLLEKGFNPVIAGSSVSILLGFGVIGTLVGGTLKDRFGFRSVLIASILLSAISMTAFTLSRAILQMVNLAIAGVATMMMLPIGIALVQERFPNNRSLANGIYLATLFAINALAGVFTGFLYDKFGGFNTFLWSGIVSILGIPFVYLIPKDESTPVN